MREQEIVESEHMYRFIDVWVIEILAPDLIFSSTCTMMNRSVQV